MRKAIDIRRVNPDFTEEKTSSPISGVAAALSIIIGAIAGAVGAVNAEMDKAANSGYRRLF